MKGKIRIKSFLFRLLITLIKIPFFILEAGFEDKKRSKTNLQDSVMGERIPFSDDYYIPDDPSKK